MKRTSSILSNWMKDRGSLAFGKPSQIPTIQKLID